MSEPLDLDPIRERYEQAMRRAALRGLPYDWGEDRLADIGDLIDEVERTRLIAGIFAEGYQDYVLAVNARLEEFTED